MIIETNTTDTVEVGGMETDSPIIEKNQTVQTCRNTESEKCVEIKVIYFFY